MNFIYSSLWQLSYQIVDALIWLGIRDMINDFRKKRLNLRRVTYLSGSYSSPLDVPYAYIWSPHLVPKPKGQYLYFSIKISWYSYRCCYWEDVILIWSCPTLSWSCLILSSADWGPKIDVVGFCFLDLASTYEPPDSLVKWLEDGEKPIYIGFGSLVSFLPHFYHIFYLHLLRYSDKYQILYLLLENSLFMSLPCRKLWSLCGSNW